MPPTRTTKFGLLKPQVGGDENAWGATLNVTLDTIDTSIFGAYVPTVANKAARDALFTIPSADQRVRRADTGYIERFDGVLGFWVPDGHTRALGPIGDPLAIGAHGDGVLDDTTFITTIDGRQATGGVAELPPGTFFLNTPGTINLAGHWKPRRGGIFKIGANTILNFQFPPEAGNYQIFDISLANPNGGYVTYSGNNIPVVNPYWSGVKGDNATDDSQTNIACINSIPNRGKARYSLGMQMKLNFLVPIVGRSGIELEADGFPGDGYFNDNTPSFIEAGATVGKILIGIYNCGYVRVKGFQFQSSGAGLDVDQFQTSTTIGSPAFSIDTPGAFVPGTGPAILSLLKPNSIIRTGGVYTTILNVTDPTHGNLSVNATFTGLGGNNIGSVATFGAGAIQPDNSRISTWIIVERCKFLGVIGAKGWVGRSIAKTGGSNTDFNLGIENFYAGNGQTAQMFHIAQNGNGFGRAVFNPSNSHGGVPGVGFSSPGGTITTGTNIFAVTNDTFTTDVDPIKSMEGARFALEGAGTAGQGPNGTRGALDASYLHIISTKSISLWTDATMTTPVNAQATVNLGTLGHEPQFVVGESLGIGLFIGPAQNSHHNKEYRSQFVACGIGCQILAGSINLYDIWSTSCSLALYVGSQLQLPSLAFNWNSENDEQHLFLQTQETFTEKNSRHYMSFCRPSDGFYKILATGGTSFLLEDTRVEGAVAYSCAIFNLSQATSCAIRSVRNHWFDAHTLTEMGWAAGMPSGAVVYVTDNSWSNPDGSTVPLLVRDVVTSALTQSNGVPIEYYGNTIVIGTGSQAPATSVLRANSLTFFFVNGPGGVKSPAILCEWADGTFHTYQMVVKGEFTLSDAASVNVPVDATQGDFAMLNAGRTNSNIQAPTGMIEGQELEIQVYATNGAGCTPTFNGGVPGVFTWIGGAAPANLIAANKSRKFAFRFRSGLWEERWHSTSDIS